MYICIYLFTLYESEGCIGIYTLYKNINVIESGALSGPTISKYVFIVLYEFSSALVSIYFFNFSWWYHIEDDIMHEYIFRIRRA